MITDEITIGCDICEEKMILVKPVEYRISSLFAQSIVIGKSNGWVFERDDLYKLVRVLCPECAGKRN